MTSSHAAIPAVATRYILGLAIAGLGCLIAIAATTQVPVLTGPGLALAVASFMSVLVPLRFQYRGNVHGVTLGDGVLVAMLLALPGGQPALLHVGAATLADVALRARPMKLLFNFGQIAIASSMALLIFRAIGPGPEVMHWRSALAAVAAATIHNLATGLALAELFRRLEGRPYRRSLAEVGRLNLVATVGNVTFGLILAIVAGVSTSATLLASTLLVGLYLGYRGYAGLLEERRRADRLHEVTRTLVDLKAPVDALEAFEAFGGGLRDLLGAERAEIAILDPRPRIMSLSGDGVVEFESPSPEVVTGLDRRTATRFEPEQGQGRSAMVAPLAHSGQTIGAIAVFDRHGLEPWDDTDLTLLAAVANEAAVAVKNIELFAKLERERARFEAESTKLGDIVNAASDGIALIDRSGEIVTWNAALADITGVSQEHTIGQPWFVPLRIRDEDGADVLPGDGSALTAALEGNHRRDALSFQVLRRDGQWRILRATFAPVLREDAEPIGTVVVARDVTGEREVEGLKADFIATVSHELRTPLTPLKGFLTTLQHRGVEMEGQQLQTVFDAMAGQVSRLENLISDLLIVADLDRGAVALRGQPLDVGMLVGAAVDEEQRDARVRLVVPEKEPPHVVGDPAAFLRIVRALVSNALKHTEGAVTVTIGRQDADGVVRVSDEGPGIPLWDQRQVFQRFHRLGDHLTRTQGPGLGLAIARALTERMGGRLELSSDVETGSVFTVALPLAHPRDLDMTHGTGRRLAGA